ncbi:hypothetical protein BILLKNUCKLES_58 [Mycobacterium phage BillKnuckles]|uniref:Uncharacterized protein n=1 Tax=Mycobacterium phage BillKnuckles TaxID=2902892 RepID=G8I6K5_9CAUD|nr:hypothetical protein CM11_gp58 [Mycobacterium phage BillKnuckles]AER48349.1 hypothetical protein BILLKNUCKLES_58 [Mycobacterium phage BillKnuckles]
MVANHSRRSHERRRAEDHDRGSAPTSADVERGVSIEQLIAYSIIAWGAGLWLVGWLDGGG